jgi:hypothetical protein
MSPLIRARSCTATSEKRIQWKFEKGPLDLHVGGYTIDEMPTAAHKALIQLNFTISNKKHILDLTPDLAEELVADLLRALGAIKRESK